MTLALNKTGGGAISPDKPYTAYMDVECVNKDVCDNTTVALELHPGSARVVGIKAKSLRLQELLKRLHAGGEFEVDDGSEVHCPIKLTSTQTVCIPVTFTSKESGETERTITFDIVKKQGRWQVKPGGVTFQ